MPDEALIHSKVTAIAEDRQHGATELARRALEVLAEVLAIEPADERQQLWEQTACAFVKARPSMSGLANVVIRASRAADRAASLGYLPTVPLIPRADVRSAEAVREIKQRIQALQRELDHGQRALAEHAAQALGAFSRIFTFSYSGTVLTSFEHLTRQSQRRPVVWVAESRPGREGVRTAARLAEIGYPVGLIADAAAAHHLAECQAAVIGADSLLPDGTVYNKMGSLVVALAARHHNVSLFVLTLTHKLRLTDDLPELEAMDPAELGSVPPGVTAHNIYFEPVPAELITHLLTDQGPMTPSQLKALRARWLGQEPLAAEAT